MAARTKAQRRPAPKPVAIGEPQELTSTVEYGSRPIKRLRYRAPTADRLVGTELEGKNTDQIDSFYKNALEQWARTKRHEHQFTVLPGGIYQIDLLQPLPPMPNRKLFSEVYPSLRAAHIENLKLIVGWGEGGPLVSDADEWPHAIIGGASGSGKSVYLNSLMAQMGDKSPDVVRLALADMAGVGLPPYERLPHCIRPMAASVEELVLLAEFVEREMELRQLFLRSRMSVKQADGRLVELDPLSNVVYWNDLVSRQLGRPDLALPRVLLVADEWKMAMDSGAGNAALVQVVGGLLRKGRKYGVRVWLVTQEPKKTDTFPGDMMVSLDTRIALAKGADHTFWGLVLRNRTLGEDLPRLKTTEGNIPHGRGVLLIGGKAQPFQGLFISEAPDEDTTYSSELSRLVRKQASSWSLDSMPAARLLGDRPYAVDRPARITIDPSLPGDEAVIVTGADRPAEVEEASGSGSGYTFTTRKPSIGTAGPAEGHGAASAEEANPSPAGMADNPSVPMLPSQAELLDLSAHTALRALFAWQFEAWAVGQGKVGISNRTYRAWLEAKGLKAGNGARINDCLATLTAAGLLTEPSASAPRHLVEFSYTAALAALDAWLAKAQSGDSDSELDE